MIYTVTFNPSVDYIMKLDKLNQSEVNRSCSEYCTVGGKGINVSVVLAELGADTAALGFAGGFVGDEIIRQLAGFDFKSDFIYLKDGVSRINIKLKAAEETEINAKGPYISDTELDMLYKKLENISGGDMLVLAGSAADGVCNREYQKLAAFAAERGANTVVDTTGDMLRNSLLSKPFLIKPNIHELGALFGKKLNNMDEVEFAARTLLSEGAQNVLVSLGGEGALLLCADGSVMKQAAPTGRVINTTGAGDSMVAGFLAEYLNSGSFENSLRMAVASGSAAAFSEGLPKKCDILNIYRAISLK